MSRNPNPVIEDGNLLFLTNIPKFVFAWITFLDCENSIIAAFISTKRSCVLRSFGLLEKIAREQCTQRRDCRVSSELYSGTVSWFSETKTIHCDVEQIRNSQCVCNLHFAICNLHFFSMHESSMLTTTTKRMILQFDTQTERTE